MYITDVECRILINTFYICDARGPRIRGINRQSAGTENGIVVVERCLLVQ